MRNLIRTSVLLSSVFALSGIASPAGIDTSTGPAGSSSYGFLAGIDTSTGPAGTIGSANVALLAAMDSSTGPNGVIPPIDPVAPGYATSVQVTLNSASSTATVVYLSSSSCFLSVPASITIPAGSTVGYATAYASISAPPTKAVVTATANGIYAIGPIAIQ